MEVTGRELSILKEKKQLSMQSFFGLVKIGAGLIMLMVSAPRGLGILGLHLLRKTRCHSRHLSLEDYQ